MKTLFRYLLLLGAMIGLFWQGVAYASLPCSEMQQEQGGTTSTVAGKADCMSAEKQSRDNVSPCKDMEAGCGAMAGCASLAALEAMPVAVAANTIAAKVASWPAPTILDGRAEAPIPDPPTILG